MSYRAPEQELEGPIENIMDAMKEFDEAAIARIESGEWKKEHLNTISELSLEMRRLKFKLMALKKETW